jgi:hypothetical protein
MHDSLALGGGRQNFFCRRSFKATLSSMASARSRFSLAFSSSKLFRMVGDAAGEMVSTTPSFRRRFRMLRGDVDVGE